MLPTLHAPRTDGILQSLILAACNVALYLVWLIVAEQRVAVKVTSNVLYRYTKFRTRYRYSLPNFVTRYCNDVTCNTLAYYPTLSVSSPSIQIDKLLKEWLHCAIIEHFSAFGLINFVCRHARSVLTTTELYYFIYTHDLLP